MFLYSTFIYFAKKMQQNLADEDQRVSDLLTLLKQLIPSSPALGYSKCSTYISAT